MNYYVVALLASTLAFFMMGLLTWIKHRRRAGKEPVDLLFEFFMPWGVASLIAFTIVHGMGLMDRRHAIEAALPDTLVEAVARDGHIVRVRAHSLLTEIRQLTEECKPDLALGVGLDTASAENVEAVLETQGTALTLYLNRKAVRSPAYAIAMAGLASEMGLRVGPEWSGHAYSHVAVASVEDGN